MSYKYLLYGFKVESEFKIDEAYEKDFEGQPDFTVVLGAMPESLLEKTKDIASDEFYCFVNAESMAFRIVNVAEYLVSADKITVNLIREDVNQEVKTFLLGSAFGYAMILHKSVVLHGGAVAKNNKGVIITGESGAGKSTVTNGLQERGYAFIADDVCSISRKDNKPHINLAYPQQKLCRDAALNLGYDLSELIYINEERDKFAVRLRDNYLPEGMSFNYIFEIVLSDGDELEIKKVTGHDKLQLLLRNVYRGEGAFSTWGVPVDYMKMCLLIASSIEAYQIARPKNKNTLEEVLEFVEKQVRE